MSQHYIVQATSSQGVTHYAHVSSNDGGIFLQRSQASSFRSKSDAEDFADACERDFPSFVVAVITINPANYAAVSKQ